MGGGFRHTVLLYVIYLFVLIYFMMYVVFLATLPRSCPQQLVLLWVRSKTPIGELLAAIRARIDSPKLVQVGCAVYVYLVGCTGNGTKTGPWMSWTSIFLFRFNLFVVVPRTVKSMAINDLMTMKSSSHNTEHFPKDPYWNASMSSQGVALSPAFTNAPESYGLASQKETNLAL